MKQGDIVRLTEARYWFCADDQSRDQFEPGSSFLLVELEGSDYTQGRCVRSLRTGKNYYGVGHVYGQFEPLPEPTP